MRFNKNINKTIIETATGLQQELALTKQKLEAAEARWLSERQLNDALQRQVTAAQLHIKELREALMMAAEYIADWGAYASEYFQDKWNLKLDIAKVRAVAAKQPDTRALDKALLEARIEELDRYLQGRCFMADRVAEHKAKLAELNKEIPE